MEGKVEGKVEGKLKGKVEADANEDAESIWKTSVAGGSDKSVDCVDEDCDQR